MSIKDILVVGSGKRVQEAALPALRRLRDRYRVRGVYAKNAKRIEVEGDNYDVAAFEGLRAEDLAGTDLLYLAVAKGAVPAVLARLAQFDVSDLDLLIDTPVVRFRHFRHTALLRAYRNVWVSEDCAYLPWYDVVRRVVERGDIGALVSVTFFHSAYAYHGVAMAKTILGAPYVRSGRRTKVSANEGRRILKLAGGRQATIYEPRDYATGRFTLQGTNGVICDHEDGGAGSRILAPVVSGADCLGFRIDDVETRLAEDEVDLMRGSPSTAGVTARMDPMKRVGFLRLLRDIHEGRGCYSLDDSLEDMVVDYQLEKVGMYLKFPLTSPRYGLGRFVLKAVTRAGGG